MGMLSVKFLLLLASIGYAQNSPNPCNAIGPTLVCQGQMPVSEDLGEAIETLVVYKLPEGTWLSSEADSSVLVGGALQKIEIQKSSIQKIDPGYFATLTGHNKLKKLVLRGVKGDVIVDKSMLQGLTKSLNQLSVLSRIGVNLDALNDLTVLSELELVDTEILGNPSSLIKLLKKLRLLNIGHTNLKTLPWIAVANWVEEDKTRSLQILENEWTCDCSIAVLKNLSPSVLQRNLQSLKCSGPAGLEGRILGEIQQEELCADEPKNSTGDASAGAEKGGDSGNNLTGSRATEDAGSDTGNSKTKMIIAGVVVGVIILAFVLFIIIYRARVSSAKKRETGGPMVQNKKYVSVIETPLPENTPSYNNNNTERNARYSQGRFTPGSAV